MVLHARYICLRCFLEFRVLRRNRGKGKKKKKKSSFFSNFAKRNRIFRSSPALSEYPHRRRNHRDRSKRNFFSRNPVRAYSLLSTCSGSYLSRIARPVKPASEVDDDDTSSPPPFIPLQRRIPAIVEWRATAYA